jgi:hypothetical protein
VGGRCGCLGKFPVVGIVLLMCCECVANVLLMCCNFPVVGLFFVCSRSLLTLSSSIDMYNKDGGQ